MWSSTIWCCWKYLNCVSFSLNQDRFKYNVILNVHVTFKSLTQSNRNSFAHKQTQHNTRAHTTIYCSIFIFLCFIFSISLSLAHNYLVLLLGKLWLENYTPFENSLIMWNFKANDDVLMHKSRVNNWNMLYLNTKF